MPAEPADITLTYLRTVTGLLERIHAEEHESIGLAAQAVAAQVRQDRLVYIFGPGGHSNLAAQEVFFRAGGLMHVSAILDEGTLLSNGALRSMAIERTPGYGRVDIAVDTKVPVGDAVTRIDGVSEPVGAVSTFTNAYALNAMVLRAVELLADSGMEPPVWRSGNAPGGDDANARFLAKFRDRVRKL
jgi:uncharacterized phosphosugar-binding protein